MDVSLRWPMALVVLSILLGTALGALFGISEDRFKFFIQAQLSQNAKLTALPEEQRAKEGAALKDKSWQYFKRAHMHGGAIAALSLGMIVLLNFLKGGAGFKKTCAYLLAIGGLLYPFFWLAAGIESPSLGTSAAKEKYQFLAAGGLVHLLGTVSVLSLVFRRSSWRSETLH